MFIYFVSHAEAKAESRPHNARTVQGSSPAQEQGKAGELGVQEIREKIGNALPIYSYSSITRYYARSTCDHLFNNMVFIGETHSKVGTVPQHSALH